MVSAPKLMVEATCIGKGRKLCRADRSHCLTAKLQRCGGEFNRDARSRGCGRAGKGCDLRLPLALSLTVSEPVRFP